MCYTTYHERAVYMSEQVQEPGHHCHVQLFNLLLSIAMYSASTVHQYAQWTNCSHPVHSTSFLQYVHKKTEEQRGKYKMVIVW